MPYESHPAGAAHPHATSVQATFLQTAHYADALPPPTAANSLTSTPPLHHAPVLGLPPSALLYHTPMLYAPLYHVCKKSQTHGQLPVPSLMGRGKKQKLGRQ